MLVAGGPTWLADLPRFPRSAPSLRVWESRTGQVVARLRASQLTGQKVFHPNGRHLAVNDQRGVQIWDMRSEKEVKLFLAPKDSSVRYLAFSPDGKTLATGHPDGTILLWDADLPLGKPEPARPGELDALWRDLGGDDAPKALRAAWRMAELPREAVPFVRARLKPSTDAPAESTRAMIAALDADTLEARDKAADSLCGLGFRAERAVRAALRAPASAEQKRRLEKLVAELDRAVPTAEQARGQRAALALAWSWTPEGRALLKELSGGAASDVVTRCAKAALDRRR